MKRKMKKIYLLAFIILGAALIGSIMEYINILN